MALDHYVSQVHLKNFYAESLGSRLYAIRKADLHPFPAASSAICRIDDGSTNTYLTEPRVIEEFLKEIEPKYNKAITWLTTTPAVDHTLLFALSGFIAYVLSCSPTAMRTHADQLASTLEETARQLDKRGQIAAPPPSLAGATLTELLNNRKITIDVDPKYPQAIGIAQIFSSAQTLGNFHWEVLINEHADSPFFTSDFPVTIEEGEHPFILNRIVPLTPRIAVRLRPRLDVDPSEMDFSYAYFTKRLMKVSRNEVMAVNRLIVRCAEKLVFYSQDLPWIKGFVKKTPPTG